MNITKNLSCILYMDLRSCPVSCILVVKLAKVKSKTVHVAPAILSAKWVILLTWKQCKPNCFSMENRHKDFIDSLSVEHAGLIVQDWDKPDGLDGLWNFYYISWGSLNSFFIVIEALIYIFSFFLYLFAFLLSILAGVIAVAIKNGISTDVDKIFVAFPF